MDFFPSRREMWMPTMSTVGECKHGLATVTSTTMAHTHFRAGACGSENAAARTVLTLNNSTGSVGIGTTNPSLPLQVVGNANGLISDFLYSPNGTGVGFSGGTVNTTVNIFSDYSGSATEPSLHLATWSKRNDADGITIGTSGNVGVGIAPSTNRLEVNGTVHATNIVATYQDVAEWV